MSLDMVSGSMTVYWTGACTVTASGNTPFGFYDSDERFQGDAPKAAIWAARRLGYPIMDIELKDINFYACFEEACNEYSAQVNQFRIRENMLYLQGSQQTNMSNREIKANMGKIIKLSNQYGTEVGVGGNVQWYSASLDVKTDQSTYDLMNLNFEKTGSGREDIEITRIFHQPVPAMTRFFDPFVGSGYGIQQMMDTFGFGGMSPAVQFQMMPIYEDILRMQAIEFNDIVRKSGYGFELTNNMFRIMPTPRMDLKVWFRYIIRSERDNANASSGSIVTDYSNAGFDFIEYKNINDVGRQWIFKYFLALCKELLGMVRSKYQSIEIPGSTIAMDGDTLRSEASSEKEGLITQLRETLEQVSLSAQLEARKNQTDNLMGTMQKIPLAIYIGVIAAFVLL